MVVRQRLNKVVSILLMFRDIVSRAGKDGLLNHLGGRLFIGGTP